MAVSWKGEKISWNNLGVGENRMILRKFLLGEGTCKQPQLYLEEKPLF